MMLFFRIVTITDNKAQAPEVIYFSHNKKGIYFLWEKYVTSGACVIKVMIILGALKIQMHRYLLKFISSIYGKFIPKLCILRLAK